LPNNIKTGKQAAKGKKKSREKIRLRRHPHQKRAGYDKGGRKDDAGELKINGLEKGKQQSARDGDFSQKGDSGGKNALRGSTIPQERRERDKGREMRKKKTEDPSSGSQPQIGRPSTATSGREGTPNASDRAKLKHRSTLTDKKNLNNNT